MEKYNNTKGCHEGGTDKLGELLVGSTQMRVMIENAFSRRKDNTKQDDTNKLLTRSGE